MRSSDRAALGGLVTLAVVLGVLATSIFFSLPSNVVSVRDGGSVRVFWAKALPQGWAFFTKPPSDSELVAYRVVEGELVYASLTPNSRPRNLFGLTRTQRAQGPEIAAMANQLGISGTPGWVVGEQTFNGAVGRQAIGEAIEAARRS